MNNELIGRKFSLDLVKDCYDLVIRNFDAHKETAKIIVNFGSILFSIVGFAHILGKQMNMIVILFGGGLYLSILIVSLFIIKPITLHFPVKHDWETLDTNLFNKTEKEGLEIKICAYINAIDINKKIESTLYRWVKADQVLFILMALVTILVIVL